MKPLIGISTHQALVGEGEIRSLHLATNVSYVKAVRRAGGIPVLLPLVEPDDATAILERVDGFVLTGGVDVDPAAYGALTAPETIETDPARDALDLALCAVAVERDVPTLAICRGSQVLNVALGGTLVQHVPRHFDVPRYDESVHRVKVAPESALCDWLGTDVLEVNSLHHQASETVGRARVVANAEDGTIEGIEPDGSRRIVGVQWHPEMLRHRPEHLALFATLVRLSS